MTIHTTGAVPDLFSEEVGSDPFSAYAELRALGPVYDEQNDLWLLTRHADVIHALHEPRIFSSAGGYSEFMSGRAGPGDASGRANALRFDDLMGSRVMIASDPPDHTLLRRVVSRPFTKRRIAEWERMAQDLAADLLDVAEERLRSGESIDFTKDIAIPLPVTLIAGILGIPAERMADFRRWSEALVGALAASVDLERVGADLLEMSQFFSEVVGARRQDPGDDLISAIAAATPDGEQLSQIEVVLFSSSSSSPATRPRPTCSATSSTRCGITRRSGRRFGATLSRRSTPSRRASGTAGRSRDCSDKSLRPIDSVMSSCPPRRWCTYHSPPPTATSRSSKQPTRSNSIATAASTSPSGTGSTIASGHSLLVWRREWCWRNSLGVISTSSLTAHPPRWATPCCGATRASRSRWPDI